MNLFLSKKMGTFGRSPDFSDLLHLHRNSVLSGGARGGGGVGLGWVITQGSVVEAWTEEGGIFPSGTAQVLRAGYLLIV